MPGAFQSSSKASKDARISAALTRDQPKSATVVGLVAAPVSRAGSWRFPARWVAAPDFLDFFISQPLFQLTIGFPTTAAPT